MGSREGALKAASMIFKPCPRGCGRRTYRSLDLCHPCKQGAPPVGEHRYCDTCGNVLRNVIRATRCKRCTVRLNFAAGRYENRRDPAAWTKEEVDRLISMAGICSSSEIAATLHRTLGAVQNKAYLLGVSLDVEKFTPASLATLFGTEPPTVRRYWIAPGLIPAKSVERGNVPACLAVRPADVEAFIREYPWMYDPSKMTPRVHPLVQLAYRVHRRDPWLTAREVAARTGVSVQTVRRWCRDGRLPHKERHVGTGGRYMVVRESDVETITPVLLQTMADAREQRCKRMNERWKARKAA